jgi:hypothetical protein
MGGAVEPSDGCLRLRFLGLAALEKFPQLCRHGFQRKLTRLIGTAVR